MKTITPSRPACLVALAKLEGLTQVYERDEDGLLGNWTDKAMFAMNEAFCAAVRAAHPELL